MPQRITSDQRAVIRRALAQGKSAAAIAKELGVSVRQVAAVAAHVTMGSYRDDPARGVLMEAMGRTTAEPLRPPDTKISLSTDLVSSTGRVLVGDDYETHERVYWDPFSSNGTANPHLLIVGGSGFGKTYACSCLIAELTRRGLPAIVFDYAEGFSARSLPHDFAQHVKLNEVIARRTGIDLNPLQQLPSDELGPVDVAQRVADTFRRVFPQLGIQQYAFLRDAILAVLARAGIRAETPSSWRRAAPPFTDLRDYMNEIAESVPGTNRHISRTLAAHISTLFVFNTLRRRGHKLDWNEITTSSAGVTVLQLKGLEHSLSKTLTEFLLWSLIGFAEDRGPGSMRAFIVLDEAHRLALDEGSPVDRLLREGRKLGLGVILASQQPSDFTPVAYANTDSKLIFQVDDRSYVSRQLARKTSSHSQRQLEGLIARLPRGVAYAVLGNSGRIVEVAGFEKRVDEWRRQI